MFVCLVLALLFVVVAFVAGWLLVLWLMVKHPILGVPIAAYVGLALWLGANDAQALTCYVLIALAFWRLVHKRSCRRLAGRWLWNSWPARRREVPAHPEDPMGQMRTVG